MFNNSHLDVFIITCIGIIMTSWGLWLLHKPDKGSWNKHTATTK